jgi:hypothetical protein
MKVFRNYHCDFGHNWEVYVDENTPETETDCRCTEGHEAITCSTEIPADLVQLTICPAMRIIGLAPLQQVVLERMFRVFISDREGNLLRTSKEVYTFRNAVNMIERFTNKTAADACAYWDHINP